MSYFSHLACTVCNAQYPKDRVMNLCERDGRPLQVVLDLERLASERGRDGWWSPDRRNLWRFGGLLPLDYDSTADRRHITTLGEGHTPSLPYAHPLAERVGCRLEVKDEGRHYRGFGGNPTLSFKDRGMAMTVSMARSLGLTRLAVPTQGNAGDSLAEYAVAAGIEAVIAMSPDTDLPVLGKVAAYARLHPDRVTLDLVAGTIIDCARRIREEYLPRGYFSVATFQEPGWRTEGKKTLGLEMAEPAGDRLPERRWQLPDVIVYPDRRRHRRRRHGQGVRRARGARPGRPRPPEDGLRAERGEHADRPRLRRPAHADIEPRPPGRTIATGLNVAQNIGHVNVLRIIRETGGCALDGLRGRDRRRDPRRVARPAIRLVARRRRDRWPPCPSWPTGA